MTIVGVLLVKIVTNIQGIKSYQVHFGIWIMEIMKQLTQIHCEPKNKDNTLVRRNLGLQKIGISENFATFFDRPSPKIFQEIVIYQTLKT